MVDYMSHEAAAHEAASLPVTIPGKPIGRDEPLKALYAQLKANQTAQIYGEAGMGKTVLAATLASAFTQQPGGVLWFNVYNSSLEELLVRVGRAYNVSEIMTSDTPLGMIGAVASTLRRYKPLVILDGRIDPQVANNFINKCVSDLPAILVTEEEFNGPWTSVELASLDPDSAATMYKQQSNLTDHTYDTDIFGIVKTLRYMPYAITIAARSMLASKQTPPAYYKVLHEAVETAGGNVAVAALTTSNRALNGALQGLMLMMGATFGGHISAELLSMVSGAALDSIQQAMNILVQLQLVQRSERYGAPYYRLHRLTYGFARNILRSSDRLEGLQSKLCDAALKYASEYSTGDPDSHDKLAAEMDTFLEVARWAASEDGDDDTANQLVATLNHAGDFATARGYVYELLNLRGFGSTRATAFPAYSDPADRAALTDEEEFDDEEFDDELQDEEIESATTPAEVDVDAAIDSGDLDQLRVARSQLRQQGDVDRQIDVLEAIGEAQVDQGMENEAIVTYSEILSLYEEEEDSNGILDTLDMLSALMVKDESAQAAILHATRGISLAEELGEPETRMHLFTTLGDARQQLGESEDAERAYSQALEIARTSGDRQNEAIILFKLGYAQLDNGQARVAIDIWEQALTLFREQQKRDYEGRTLGALGAAYAEDELWAEAINFYTSALYIAREVKDSEEEALQLGNLGYAAIQSNQLGQAVLRYRQALHLYYEADDHENIFSTIVDLVKLLVESKRHLTVAELLIDDALGRDPDDKEISQLKARVINEKQVAEANGVQFIAVSGSAQEYAENAYDLLNQ